MKIKLKTEGFTLIELLVVISIIAILMAIMMPALRKAREQAIAVVCSSRQKDTGLALNLYSQDWNGALPRAYWGGAGTGAYTRLPYKLAPYYNQNKDNATSAELFSFELYSCPAQPKWLTGENGETVERGKSATGSYGYNRYFFYGYNPGGNKSASEYVERNVADIRDGSNLPLYACISAEAYMGFGAGGGQELKFSGPHPKALKYGFLGGKANPGTIAKTDSFGPAPNHGRNCNMLMGDFSVRAVNVCVDGEFPWIDYVGTMFHPSRASSRGFETR